MKNCEYQQYCAKVLFTHARELRDKQSLFCGLSLVLGPVR
jgi:hypothetical protein